MLFCYAFVIFVILGALFIIGGLLIAVTVEIVIPAYQSAGKSIHREIAWRKGRRVRRKARHKNAAS